MFNSVTVSLGEEFEDRLEAVALILLDLEELVLMFTFMALLLLTLMRTISLSKSGRSRRKSLCFQLPPLGLVRRKPQRFSCRVWKCR